MRKTPQVVALCSMFGMNESELTKHTKNVYEWRGVLWEIVGVKSPTVQLDHYIVIEIGKNRTWLIRELGKKSKLYKEIYAIRAPEVGSR
jgi:hypothetical protein